MRQIDIRFLMIMSMTLMCVFINAHDIAVKNEDGVTIFYNYIGESDLEVTMENNWTDSYSGIVSIPSQVEYNNKTRTVTSIGIGAFALCTKLESVTIPNSVTSIGGAAFYGCESLTSITIPNGVTYIYNQTFLGCINLQSISIPDGVTNIGNQAFGGCYHLTDVTIPNSVTSIGEQAFYACGRLTTVNSLIENPFDLDEKTFDLINYITLYVPIGTKDKYLSKKGWKECWRIEESSFGVVYKLTYTIDDEEYTSYNIDYGASIIPEEEPYKEGYTFSGWSEIPETMPAHDVMVTGSFSINSYKLTYMIDSEVYKETTYEYGATIVPEPQPEGNYESFEWEDLPETMPAHDIVVRASYTTGINVTSMKSLHNVRVFSLEGKKMDEPQKGLNIVVRHDGTIQKYIMK